jgi:hypothetical protein
MQGSHLPGDFSAFLLKAHFLGGHSSILAADAGRQAEATKTTNCNVGETPVLIDRGSRWRAISTEVEERADFSSA